MNDTLAPRRSRGVYFLANDRILDLAIAFLNSFRLHNPAIPLCLIPFADDYAGVAALASRYRFSVWPDQETLERCDRLGEPFHGRVLGHYRKLAMWSGPFEEFVYIDCDTVVLRPVDFVFDLLDRHGFVTSHSNMRSIRQFVWRDSIYAQGRLDNLQIAYSANTGFVTSRRGLISLDEVEGRLEETLALAPHMALECCEQPLLNYLMVTSGHSYTSLFVIAVKSRDRTVPLEEYAGHEQIGTVQDGRVTGPPGRPPTLLVHWAGEWDWSGELGQPIPHYDLWQYYRHLDPARIDASATQLDGEPGTGTHQLTR